MSGTIYIYYDFIYKYKDKEVYWDTAINVKYLKSVLVCHFFHINMALEKKEEKCMSVRADELQIWNVSQ